MRFTAKQIDFIVSLAVMIGSAAWPQKGPAIAANLTSGEHSPKPAALADGKDIRRGIQFCMRIGLKTSRLAAASRYRDLRNAFYQVQAIGRAGLAVTEKDQDTLAAGSTANGESLAPSAADNNDTKLKEALVRGEDKASLSTREGILEVDGFRRSYRFHVPVGYNGTHSLPLLLAFHGRLGTGKGMEAMTHFSRLADRYGFIAVYPDGVQRSWHPGQGLGAAEAQRVDDVKFVATLIDELERIVNIDPHRIYAVGMSNGGILAYRLGCELGKIAAVASVAGLISADTAHNCALSHPVSVLHVHGTADLIVPWHGAENKAGGRILSVAATLEKWLQLDKCSSNLVVTTQKGHVTCKKYDNCAAGSEVTLCIVEGGGHTWPGAAPLPGWESVLGPTNQDIDASELIWQFFTRHALHPHVSVDELPHRSVDLQLTQSESSGEVTGP
jgi:polyhydroxybutyrate depolymerase